MRSSAGRRLASSPDFRGLSSPGQVLGRFHYRRAAVHTSPRDPGNLNGDRRPALRYASSPKRHGLVPGGEPGSEISTPPPEGGQPFSSPFSFEGGQAYRIKGARFSRRAVG